MSYRTSAGLHNAQSRPLLCARFSAPLDGVLFDNCLLALFRPAVNTPLPVFHGE